MRIPRFSISQMMAIMLVFCVIATAVGYAVNQRLQMSPLVFQLMLLSAPVLLVVVVSLYASLTRTRRK